MFAVIFICGILFLRIPGKIAKIRTRKNFAPHGILQNIYDCGAMKDCDSFLEKTF